MVAGASAAIFVQRAVREHDQVARQGVAPSELGVPVAEGARRVAARVRDEVQTEVSPVKALLEQPRDLLGLHGDPVAVTLDRCVAGGCFDASALFKQANDARRRGQTEAAIAAYRELQRRAPGAREAQLSHLSLGNLLLAVGQADAALAQFDTALRSAAASGVKAEALYGRGLALGRLGRATEERANWTRLLADFGSSPYAAHARRRLGEGD
jgi:tetratricopeptide (TPR) repeat protein